MELDHAGEAAVDDREHPGAVPPADVNTVVRGRLGTAINLRDGSRVLTIRGGEFYNDGLVGEPIVGEDPFLNRTVVTINFGEVDVYLSGNGFSVTELMKIARSIKPALDLYDPTTWFPATEAFPLR